MSEQAQLKKRIHVLESEKTFLKARMEIIDDEISDLKAQRDDVQWQALSALYGIDLYADAPVYITQRYLDTVNAWGQAVGDVAFLCYPGESTIGVGDNPSDSVGWSGVPGAPIDVVIEMRREYLAVNAGIASSI